MWGYAISKPYKSEYSKLYLDMNNKQKIFILIGVGSLFLVLISIFGFGYQPFFQALDTSKVDTSYERYLEVYPNAPKQNQTTTSDAYNLYEELLKRTSEASKEKNTEKPKIISYETWSYNKNQREGKPYTDFSMIEFLEKYDSINNNIVKETNYLGIFGLLNILVSITGFFLFKDKKKIN